MISINVNSILYLITFAFYVFLLKNELEPVKFELKYEYPEEYFIDLDMNNKNIL